MKKVLMITTSLEAINEFMKRNKKYLEKDEKFKIETSNVWGPNTLKLYITDEK